MSGGMEWAYEQIEQDENQKVKAQFDALTPTQCRLILRGLYSLQMQPLYREGHSIVDYILEALGEK